MFKVRFVRSSALDVTEAKTLEQAQQALKSFRVVGQISVSLNSYHIALDIYACLLVTSANLIES